MKEKQHDIHKQLEWDERLYLEYGVPIKSIPYKEIACLLDEDHSLDVLNRTFDLVEKEKDEGRPGAFVTSEYDDEFNYVYRVYGWQDW